MAIGCGVVVVIVVVVLIAGGLFVAHKVKQAGFDPELWQKNPAVAASKMITALNPDLEVELLRGVDYYPVERLFHLLDAVQEAGEDIAGYVDPGMVTENLFRSVREARKRG